MELKTCDYCGTTYDARLSQCPLCGRAADSKRTGHRAKAQEAEKKPKGKKAKENADSTDEKSKQDPYRIGKGMMIAICVVLGIAVFCGALFALSNLGWFPIKLRFLKPQQAESQAEQVTQEVQTEPVAEETYMNEEDQTPEEKLEPQETVECTKLTLSVPTVTFDKEGNFFNLTFTREPANCSQTVTFVSSNPEIASVTEHGKITACNAGSATVTATCGDQTATCLVTCDFTFEQTADETLDPKLNREDMTFFTPGEQFTLVLEPVKEDTVITFTSEDPSVAEVDEDGVVSAMSSGTTTITASTEEYGDFTCVVRCDLSDSAESTELEISHKDVTMGFLNENFQISLKDADGNTVTGLLWTSEDNSVCTVDGDGIVSAAGVGTTCVTTTYMGVTYQCIVRCNF